MLIRCVGAFLMVAACTWVGLGRSREFRRRVEVLHLLLTRLERLTTEVCCLYTPLPRALELLCETNVEESALRDSTFSELWCREIERLDLPLPEREAMEELGHALSRGDEPERAFRAVGERLRSLLREAEEEADKKCRLCSSLGVCTGVLLVIVLI